jgi:amino acid transporter
LFSTTPLVSILLTLQIVPYFMTGFESVPKYAEESSPEFRQKNYMWAIALALGMGAFFYSMCIAAVTYAAPWRSLLGKRFATAIAFESALKAHWPVTLIFTMALLGLFQCFNGNFAASTRLLFAFGRRGTIHASFGSVHERFQTPHIAVLGVTAGSIAGLFLGDALLVPVTEVGSMASAVGWFAACASFWMVDNRARVRIATGLGVLVSLTLVLMKVLPVFPGHFSPAEWIAFGIWVALGAALHWGKS